VSITALDAVDKGRVRLDDKVTLTRSDLTLFHQPIAQKILGGVHTTTLSSLMWEAITKSDNTANDKLMRSVGGPEAVRAMIANKKLGAIRFYDGERALQSKIAGLIWTQSYSVGGAFYQARDALPAAVRKAAFDRYVADPYDGAAPSAIVGALARLKRGELLSPDSTSRLLTIMSNTRTGANRLKGGLKPGWKLSHKTGTGQVYGAFQAGYNDIGILTGPDGRSYAVAVMIKKTSTPLPTRMALMNNVVRAVITQNEITGGAPYGG
jgi:beta-lactamase class A